MKLPYPWRVLLVLLLWISSAWAAAYNARPKLVVVIVIDQFRGDYLERYREQFGDGGFRLFLDHGAYFTDCNYDYANTRTAPGHATLFSGSYSSGHGILTNEWFDPQQKKMVTSVEDGNTRLVGIASNAPGASPHNLLSDTLGDEMKLATGGKSRVFGISLKDRASVLPAGLAGDGAYWIDGKSGAWITSTYYRQELPEWVKNFNSSNRTDKYWNREWKATDGTVLGSTQRDTKNGAPASFYDVIGATPFANDYEFEFAKEMVVYEKLGAGSATDLLSISLSANDILGHQVGPDTPQMRSMALELDRQLAEFFKFLGHQVGLANVWIALSADHGIAPLPDFAKTLRLPAANVDRKTQIAQINSALEKKYGKPGEYLSALDFPMAWLNEEAFAGHKEAEAETDTGEAMKQAGFEGYFTKVQLARGELNTEEGRRYMHSYSPYGSWYVMGVPRPFQVGGQKGTDHASPFSYDTHVPLAFYGLAFQTGTYRTHAEPVDLAVTLASLLGINAPTHATGRVLVEAIQPPRRAAAPGEKQ